MKDNNSSKSSEVKISAIGRLFIDAGLKDLEEGKIFSNEEVLREVREIYGL